MRATRRRMLSGVLLVLLSAFIGLSSRVVAQTTAPNQWTWVGGSSTVTNNNGQPGIYGTLGTPSASNIPGGRDSSATWTDSYGNFWLFGGEGVDANGNFGLLNDLWKFNPSTKEWTWMGGSSSLPAACAGGASIACGQPGIYGTPGSAAAANIPGGRIWPSYWTDSNGNFWLFGGFGFDASQTRGELNDLWEFNPSANTWTWVGGSSTVGSAGGQPGVYGSLDTAAATNIPSGRDSAISWTDKSGQFWLYGGEGFDSQGNYGQLSDLWEYEPSIKEWIWVAGSSTLPAVCTTSATNTGSCGWPALYGALGVPAPGISPGSRVGAAGWTDSSGNLWLFGGLSSVYWEERDFAEIDQYDLWEFNPSTKQWAWMSGNSTSICGESTSEDWCGQDGIYGTLGTPSIANIPPSRNIFNTWSDGNGNLWLFSGEQVETTNVIGMSLCSDVWVFEPAANEWAWMNGAAQFGGYSCPYAKSIYGVPGTPAATNTPSGRAGSASWTDLSGNLWLFGGYGWSNGNVFDLNDLWIYQPVAPAPEPSFQIIASPNPINIPALGTGTAAITNGTTTVNILVAGGFNSPLTLTAVSDTWNGITDITGSFSPSTIIGAGSSTLTISVTGSAVLMTYPIPLTIAAISDNTSQSIQVIVFVTEVGQINPPSFSVPSGTYTTPQTVAISGSTYIHYTIDGTTPTQSSPVYVNPITIGSTMTLNAISIDSALDQSAVTSATYTIISAAATPTFTPGGGTYSSAQSVTINDSTPGAVIYYTTDGSTPTTSSTTYSAPITISSTETLKAIASASGYSLSAVATAVYTINIPSFSITGTAISVAPGATTGNTSTITLTPSNGFTGAINLKCTITPIAARDPATCSIPSSETISGTTAQTTTLTVYTTAPATALNRPGRFFRPSVSGTVLACILLVGIPVRRRRRWYVVGILVLLFFFVLGTLSCGGGGSGGSGGGGGNSGTTPGTYIITVTGTSGSITQEGTVSLTVQ